MFLVVLWISKSTTPMPPPLEIRPYKGMIPFSKNFTSVGAGYALISMLVVGSVCTFQTGPKNFSYL